MSLRRSTHVLLDECARAIAGDSRRIVDLSSVLPECVEFLRDGPEYLALLVGAHSRYERTIRRADIALFADHSAGPCLYLATCLPGTSEKKVTELGSDMVLVSIALRYNGFRMPDRQATPNQTAQYRELVAQAESEPSEQLQASEEVQAFLARLNAELGHHISRYPDHRLRTQLHSMQDVTPRPSLEKMSLMCVKLGISLGDLCVDLL